MAPTAPPGYVPAPSCKFEGAVFLKVSFVKCHGLRKLENDKNGTRLKHNCKPGQNSLYLLLSLLANQVIFF